MTRENGFTLLEFVIASAVFLVGVLGLLFFYQVPFVMNEIARDTTIAVQDASTVVEQMRVTSFGNIQSTNWDTWAQTSGTKHLPLETNETVSVTYAGTDPLQLTVTVQWTRRGRTRDVRLTSRRTQLLSQ